MLAVTEVFRCILQEMEPHTVGGLLSSGVSEAHLAELYEIQQFIPCLLKGKKKTSLILVLFCIILHLWVDLEFVSRSSPMTDHDETSDS